MKAIFVLLFRLLTGCKITDEGSALDCIDVIHKEHGIPTVIFSSTDIPHNDSQGDDLLATYVSHRADLATKRQRIKNGDNLTPNGTHILVSLGMG